MKRELDFIVIGAQKAGTTALFEYLRRHPRLALPAGKERPYFSHDGNYARPWDEYLHKAFTFADPAHRWGTVTTHYMVGGLYEASAESIARGLAGDVRTVPQRIHERLPDVRLIAILRDPVERAFSHHRMMVMTGFEHRPFPQAIGELLEPDALAQARARPAETSGYVVWGEYGRILGGYLDVFGPEQLLVTFSDDLLRSPGDALARIHSFIGVDYIAPENLGESYRVGASRKRWQGLSLYELQAMLARTSSARLLWHALPERPRRRVDQLFTHASYRVELWNRRHGEHTGDTTPADDLALRRLREHFQGDCARLNALIGQVPPWSSPSTEMGSAVA